MKAKLKSSNNKNIQISKNKKGGFTLIELLIVIAIIGILAAVILVRVDSGRRKAKLNGILTSLRGTLPIITICNDSNDAILPRVSGNQICASSSGSFWPQLPPGYVYVGGSFDVGCDFQVSTAGDSNNIRCQCVSQACGVM